MLCKMTYHSRNSKLVPIINYINDIINTINYIHNKNNVIWTANIVKSHEISIISKICEWH